MPRQPRLGDILVQAGLIDELQLHTALAEQQRWGNRLGVALVKLGVVATIEAGPGVMRIRPPR